MFYVYKTISGEKIVCICSHRKEVIIDLCCNNDGLFFASTRRRSGFVQLFYLFFLFYLSHVPFF